MDVQQRHSSHLLMHQLGDIHPLLARLFVGRGIASTQSIDYALTHLPAPNFKGMSEAVDLLIHAIERQKKILILADYDCDGATACALAVQALRTLSGSELSVNFLVPNRQIHGYGLTPALAQLAFETHKPDLLVTVDNGIASLEGVEKAKRLGMQVLITDHHLPGSQLPDANAIVNPNQAGCPFISKHIAGVSVMFYVMIALRAELRRKNYFAEKTEPSLSEYLDLVALGTVADVVNLDYTNRLLVHQGLERIRKGRASFAIEAMFRLQQKDPSTATTQDLAFYLAPLINSVGRLDDMSLGIAHLLAADMPTALNGMGRLLRLNKERKTLQQNMARQADEQILALGWNDNDAPQSVVLYQAGWHQGIVGILAGRMKDRLRRPVIAFADSGDNELRGSGRAPAGLHLRDTLDWVWKRAPRVITKFGGHASAAGLTIPLDCLQEFRTLFHQGVLAMSANSKEIHTSDGSLEPGFINLTTARLLASQVWGQGFPPPLFDDCFNLEKQTVVGGNHLRMALNREGQRFEAIQFGAKNPAAAHLRALYRLGINQYQGVEKVQLVIEDMEGI